MKLLVKPWAHSSSFIAMLRLTTIALACSQLAASAPSVTTSEGSTWNGLSTDSLDLFYGIPFVQPPVGHVAQRPVRVDHALTFCACSDLRWAAPVAPTSGFGQYDATTLGFACPQMYLPAGVRIAANLAHDVAHLYTSAQPFRTRGSCKDRAGAPQKTPDRRASTGRKVSEYLDVQFVTAEPYLEPVRARTA